MKTQIVQPSLEASNLCPRKQKAILHNKDPREEEPLETTNRLWTQSTAPRYMSKPLSSGCGIAIVAYSVHEETWHHGLCKLKRSRMDCPTHPPELFPLAAVDLPVMATGSDNNQAVANGEDLCCTMQHVDWESKHDWSTLNEGQCHLNWHQNAVLDSLYDHTKFERNRSINFWTQAHVKSFFLFVCLVKSHK